ncbi:MAG: hypothetical protein QXO16_04635 [Archaeoglobaceae archaeon]
MNKEIASNFFFLLLMALTVAFLSAGENKLEVYLSAFIVEYYATIAIFRPRRRFFDFLALALFIVFVAIVSAKVREVLG